MHVSVWARIRAVHLNLLGCALTQQSAAASQGIRASKEHEFLSERAIIPQERVPLPRPFQTSRKGVPSRTNPANPPLLRPLIGKPDPPGHFKPNRANRRPTRATADSTEVVSAKAGEG